MIAVSWGGGCQCGCEHSNGDEPDADVAEDVAIRDSFVDSANDADAWRLDPWLPVDACGATQIELPPSGNTIVYQVSNQGDFVVYDNKKYVNSDLQSDIYLYQLSTCTEHALTEKTDTQANPFIHQNEVIFTDSLSWDPIISEIVSFDLTTFVFSYLTQGKGAFWTKHNGRFVVYGQADAAGGEHLVLWDRVLDDELLLAQATQGAESHCISETHAAWVAWGGPGKDVYYVELETGDIVHVESTYEPTVYETTTWGDWVLWQDHRGDRPNIWGLRLSTGQENQISDNGFINQIPRLRGNIACWRTNQYGLSSGWDLVIYDMETGALRRVTTESRMGWRPGIVDSGWLVFTEEIGGDYWRRKIHAYDLVAMGLVDGDGHVVAE